MDTLKLLLETLAVDTWERLRDAVTFGIRFGEETITDLLLLDLHRQKSERARFIQTLKNKEARSGTDLECWIGSDRKGWIRYAVQAKRLNLRSRRYDGLTHKVGSTFQIDLLERYAQLNRAMPIYFLYNWCKTSAQHWHCCQDGVESKQLGCTFTPASVIRQTLSTHGSKNFNFIHGDEQTKPWRCLACPRLHRHTQAPGLKTQKLLNSDVETESFHYNQLPQRLRSAQGSGILHVADGDEYHAQADQPRRIVVLELSPEEELPDDEM